MRRLQRGTAATAGTVAGSAAGAGALPSPEQLGDEDPGPDRGAEVQGGSQARHCDRRQAGRREVPGLQEQQLGASLPTRPPEPDQPRRRHHIEERERDVPERQVAAVIFLGAGVLVGAELEVVGQVVPEHPRRDRPVVPDRIEGVLAIGGVEVDLAPVVEVDAREPVVEDGVREPTRCLRLSGVHRHEVEAVRRDDDRRTDDYPVPHDPGRDQDDRHHSEASRGPPTGAPHEPRGDDDHEQLRARSGEHEQAARHARPRRATAHQQEDHRQQQHERQGLAQEHDVVREERRVDADGDPGGHAAATTGDVGAEHRREDDDRRAERDVEELPDAHVDAGDPVEGAEQRRVQRRTERRRVQVRERERSPTMPSPFAKAEAIAW